MKSNIDILHFVEIFVEGNIFMILGFFIYMSINDIRFYYNA